MVQNVGQWWDNAAVPLVAEPRLVGDRMPGQVCAAKAAQAASDKTEIGPIPRRFLLWDVSSIQIQQAPGNSAHS